MNHPHVETSILHQYQLAALSTFAEESGPVGTKTDSVIGAKMAMSSILNNDDIKKALDAFADRKFQAGFFLKINCGFEQS
ncbi:hypothetical protein fugu_014868 [Takifugu bimaculatus]|uniref:Uncharacterized protein n=1 Tax=Takifugu bimaculatus TaxID=433685 RepID=A0A4Z2BXF6_9TELE|nr:hypothetical protein fugu_014868 [Takifugu bimaculatus]